MAVTFGKSRVLFVAGASMPALSMTVHSVIYIDCKPHHSASLG
jgi:hypothetical protein